MLIFVYNSDGMVYTPFNVTWERNLLMSKHIIHKLRSQISQTITRKAKYKLF